MQNLFEYGETVCIVETEVLLAEDKERGKGEGVLGGSRKEG